MWKRYSVRRRSLRSRPAYRFERVVTFDPTVGSPSNFYRSFLKFSQDFPDAVVLTVDVEALRGEAEVSALETSVPVRKVVTFDPTVGSPSNFYRSFFKFSQEFPEAVVLPVDVEAVLGEAEVSTLETSVPVRKARNF